MTVLTIKDQSPSEQILAQLKTWKRDAKKYQQTALYDLLNDVILHINQQYKAIKNNGKTMFEEFTRTAADAACANSKIHPMPLNAFQPAKMMVIIWE